MKSVIYAGGVVSVVFLLAITCWLGWQNRASEKVRSTILPAIAIGVVSALATMLFSLKSETKELEFPTVFIFDSDSKELLALPVPTSLGPDPYFSRLYAEMMIDRDPSLLGEKPGGLGQLYFDVLLRMVLHTLFSLYHAHWDIKHRFIDLPYTTQSATWTQESELPPVEFVTSEDMKKLFPDLPTLEVSLPPFDRMAVPLQTKVTGKTEFTKGSLVEPFLRKLSIMNPFVTIDITVSCSGGNRGVGSLAQLLRYSPEANDRLWTAIYIVQLSAKFEALRSGHPEMPKYHRWVDVLFAQLQTQLDARKHWEKAREQFLLLRNSQEQKAEMDQEEK